MVMSAENALNLGHNPARVGHDVENPPDAAMKYENPSETRKTAKNTACDVRRARTSFFQGLRSGIGVSGFAAHPAKTL